MIEQLYLVKIERLMMDGEGNPIIQTFMGLLSHGELANNAQARINEALLGIETGNAAGPSADEPLRPATGDEADTYLQNVLLQDTADAQDGDFEMFMMDLAKDRN